MRQKVSQDTIASDYSTIELKNDTTKNKVKNLKDPTRWFYSFIPFKIATGGMSPLVPILAMENRGTPVDVGIVNGIGSIFLWLAALYGDESLIHYKGEKSS